MAAAAVTLAAAAVHDVEAVRSIRSAVAAVAAHDVEAVRSIRSAVERTSTKGSKGREFSSSNVLRKILPAAGGSFIEWYEFAISLSLSPYIEANFFAGHGGSIAQWASLALTLAFRPLGGAFFGFLADTFGRKPAMQLTIAIMLVTTAVFGCLPTFRCASEAWGRFGLVVLLALRALQGMSAGGELSTAAVYITEASPRESLGYYLSWISVTGGFGAWVVADLIIALLESTLSPEAMYSWGWRLPYITSIIPGGLLVFFRQNLEETEVFEEVKKQRTEASARREQAGLEEGVSEGAAPAEREGRATLSVEETGPIQHLLASYKLPVLVGSLGLAGIGGIFYVLGGYSSTGVLQKSSGVPQKWVHLAVAISNAIPAVLALLVGKLVDAWGVGKVHSLTLTLGGLLSVPLLFWWAHVPPQQAIAAVFVGNSMIGLVLALSSSVYLWVVELFPARVRCTGVSLAYNFGIGIFGGLGPLLSEAGSKVIAIKGPISAPALYVLLTSLLSLMAVVVSRVLARRGLMRLTHIRSAPY